MELDRRRTVSFARGNRAVGADHNVVCAAITIAQGHLDRVTLLLQRRRREPEVYSDTEMPAGLQEQTV